MTEERSNVTVLKRLDLGSLTGAADLLTEDFVWRIVGGRMAEAWDIPAVHTGRPQTRREAGLEQPDDDDEARI